jgi:hypothetical protein
MTVPDRPPTRDHIKPRSKGHALDGNRPGLLPLQCRQGFIVAGALAYAALTGWRLANHVAAFVERGPAS